LSENGTTASKDRYRKAFKLPALNLPEFGQVMAQQCQQSSRN
jgi:hypothetical protein